MSLDKIKELNELELILKEHKSHGKKIVFTNGCFDLIHLGHIKYLKEAKKFGDILVIGLNSDNSVKKLKGEKRPLFSQDIRAEVLAALEMVDYVVIFEEDTPSEIMNRLRPDIQVKGGDYTPSEIPESKVLKGYGGQLKIVSFIPGFSTSEIIKKIKNL